MPLTLKSPTSASNTGCPALLPIDLNMPPPYPIHTTRRDGFTLMEMLVVLLTVALLVSLAISIWPRAIATARRVKCANQLSQIGNAYGMRRADLDRRGESDPFLATGWPIILEPYLGNNSAVLVCPEVSETHATIPDIKMFVWGSGGAERADYFLNITTAYPFWMESNCWDIYPGPGMWKVPEATLFAGGYHGESFGIEGFRGGHNNANILSRYTPGPNPHVYWYVFETARYGDNLQAGGDMDYDDVVLRVTEDHRGRRLIVEPFQIWDGQAYSLVGADGTWWPSGTKNQEDNYWRSVGAEGTEGPYYFPMGETSYGMSTYVSHMEPGTRVILALDYGQEVVNVGPLAMPDDGWDVLQTPRHMGQANVLFSDGGVEAADLDEIDPTDPDAEARYWAPAGRVGVE
jgi:prepilin-type N-terminal cleavage/methylation domain-containing protein/prepilin-type processing-associated H-X9-DG protein